MNAQWGYCISCRKPLVSVLDNPQMRFAPGLIPAVYCEWATCARYGLNTVLFLKAESMSKYNKKCEGGEHGNQ